MNKENKIYIDGVDISGCGAYKAGWCGNYFLNKCKGLCCSYKFILLQRDLEIANIRNKMLAEQVIDCVYKGYIPRKEDANMRQKNKAAC